MASNSKDLIEGFRLQENTYFDHALNFIVAGEPYTCLGLIFPGEIMRLLGPAKEKMPSDVFAAKVTKDEASQLHNLGPTHNIFLSEALMTVNNFT
ncbi:Hypothetical predicted protein [Paramuricea clavata]|uniref:Uncharacterized protein n=1 Tax=Paramuricea clavata TaxID=317549 RepID=A0A6S7J353_PARCT|nr:Hypothetical predicted protein [Paramuricea clavata]